MEKKFTWPLGPGCLIKDLPEPIQKLAFANQIKHGNKPKENILLSKGKTQGNFDWSNSNEGASFWADIFNHTSSLFNNPVFLRLVEESKLENYEIF